MESEQQQQQQLTEEQKLQQNHSALVQAIINNTVTIHEAEEAIEEAKIQNRNLLKKLQNSNVKLQEFYASKEAEKAKAEAAKPSPFVPKETTSEKSD